MALASASCSSAESKFALTVRVVGDFIEKQILQHRRRHHDRPLIIGLQGPQGSGKTTLTSSLAPYFEHCASLSGSKPLRLAVLSIDDLYLPWSQLKLVAQREPQNPLLKGRGQPGTHDVRLGESLLQSIQGLRAGDTLSLPIFDKSLHAGEGDRSEKTTEVTAPLDAVILEGWCLGFGALTEDALSDLYAKAAEEPTDSSVDDRSGRRRPYFLDYTLRSLLEINKNLEHLQNAWYPYLSAFVQLVPTSSASATPRCTPLVARDLDVVFDWRLQAEHAMKSANGGRGMSDEQVKGFVTRYMPGYELFGLASDVRGCWDSRVLRIGLDKNREVLWTEDCSDDVHCP